MTRSVEQPSIIKTDQSMDMLDIINPEVPRTPEERLELHQACMAAIAMGGRVEIHPKHTTPESWLQIQKAKKAMARKNSAN